MQQPEPTHLCAVTADLALSDQGKHLSRAWVGAGVSETKKNNIIILRRADRLPQTKIKRRGSKGGRQRQQADRRVRVSREGGRTWWYTWRWLSHCRLLRKRTPCPVSSWTEQTLLLSNPYPCSRCPLFFLFHSHGSSHGCFPRSLNDSPSISFTHSPPPTHCTPGEPPTSTAFAVTLSLSFCFCLSACLPASLSHYFHQSFFSLSRAVRLQLHTQGYADMTKRGRKYMLEHTHAHLHKLTFHISLPHCLASPSRF